MTVEGAKSIVMELCNMVFQGTVVGSMLWNSFFGDVALEVPQGRQIMNFFTDDLTVEAYHFYRSASLAVMDELSEIQSRAHDW